MSLNDVMKNHMDAVQKLTGVSGLLSMAMATDALNATLKFPYFGVVNDSTENVGNIDFDSLVENGYYLINTIKLKNMPKGAETWGTLFNFTPMGTAGYGLRVFVTSDKGIFATSYNDHYSNHWFKLGGIINPVLSVFKRVVAPLMGGVAYVA